MTCEERRDAWLVYAAGALEADERLELERHLEGGCSACAASLAEAEAIVAQLPLALPPVEAPAALRSRLLERVAAGERARPAAAAGWGRWAAAAAMVLLLAGSATVWIKYRGVDRRLDSIEGQLAEAGARVERLTAELAAKQEEIRRLESVSGHASEVLVLAEEQLARIRTLETTLSTLEGAISARDERIQLLQRLADEREQQLVAYRSPDMRIFSLAATGDGGSASARVFWDTARRRWDFHALGLKPTGVVQSYQLWFLTDDDRKVSAGTFEVAADGTGALTGISLPRDLGRVTAAAVSIEPIGGSLQPTGKIHLLGSTAS